MNFKRMTIIAAALLTATLFVFVGCALPSAPTAELGDGSTRVSQSGTNGGYAWGLYYTGSGSASVSFPSSSSIKCTWTSGITDCGFGKGWKPGSVKTVKFQIDSANNYHSVGLYGWTQNPLVEYYIDEMGNAGGTQLGTLSSDGHTYNCYKQQRTNAPSIEGTKTFWQFKNSRQSSASVGSTCTVTMSNHVNYWKSKGLSWGSSVYDLMVEMEAFSGPGSGQLTIK
jgi:endo-1,4-beta-xylanase